ncbi:uncharacterized protein [Battus philenor]|uniref:uncharacterized protein n=1 Tax=Battus philenor TaxID=42288 RepID=UPI0035CFC0DB
MFPNDSKVDDMSFIINCSINKDRLESNVEDLIYHNVSVVESRIVAANSPDLSPIIGVIFAVLVYVYMEVDIEKLRVYTKLENVSKNKTLGRISVLSLLIFTSPNVILLILLALIHKLLCFFIILKRDKNFVAFLDGFDVFWSLEDKDSRSVINVLGLIETISAEILAEKIKRKLKTVISNRSCEKLFYTRREKFGWFYWSNNPKVDLDEYVKVLNVGSDKQFLSKEDLECVMTELSHQPLPLDDEGLFQIFVTKETLEEKVTNKENHVIIFRIHHSVGDGVALIEFLCQALADTVANDQSTINISRSNYNTPSNLLDKVKEIFSAPICFVDGILRKPDEHSLHGPSLLGEKLFTWTDPDEDLFQMIKDIKQHKGLYFSDVLATSLSSGLRNYFSKTMDHIPEDVAVILPIRSPNLVRPRTNNEITFNNNFMVTIIDLPTKEKRPINEISRRYNLIRKSVDPMVNHYFLKVCYLLPHQILRPIFKSSQATLTFSNMPGPESLSICGGNLIKSLVFFIPNKGSTGLGISALYYGGVLRFAAMADANIVPSTEHLSIILNAMEDEIRQMHSLYVKH